MLPTKRRLREGRRAPGAAGLLDRTDVRADAGLLNLSGKNTPAAGAALSPERFSRNPALSRRLNASRETEAKQPWTAPRTLEGTLEAPDMGSRGQFLNQKPGHACARQASRKAWAPCDNSSECLAGVNGQVWGARGPFHTRHTCVPSLPARQDVSKTHFSPPRSQCHRRVALRGLDAHSRLGARCPLWPARPRRPSRQNRAMQLGRCQVPGATVSQRCCSSSSQGPLETSSPSPPTLVPC